jgi:hypothetical protein
MLSIRPHLALRGRYVLISRSSAVFRASSAASFFLRSAISLLIARNSELVASYRALGKAIVKNKPMTRKDRTRVAKYLREAGWEERAIGAATAQVGTSGYADLRKTG